jgi:hypothetical protein
LFPAAVRLKSCLNDDAGLIVSIEIIH